MTVTARLRTERLDLDPIVRGLASEMAGVLADPALYEFTGGTPPEIGELAATYARWAAGSPRVGETWHNWIVRLADGGPAIGHLQATVSDRGRAADIAWLIGTAWQGRGFASEGARAIVEWLGLGGITTVTAHVHPAHAASGRVAAAVGLQPTTRIEDGEVVWRLELEPRPEGSSTAYLF